EVLEHDRVARRIAQDLEEELRVELAETAFCLEADALVGIVAEVQIEAREDRARKGQRSSGGRGAQRKRRPSREDSLEHDVGGDPLRAPGVATHAAPPASATIAGRADDRSVLNRDASGPYPRA